MSTLAVFMEFGKKSRLHEFTSSAETPQNIVILRSPRQLKND